MPSSKPEPNEAAAYYFKYIQRADGVSLHHALGHASAILHKTLEGVKADKMEYRYAEGKWTIKDILQHLIDSERVFAYRALRFARQDGTDLPGFDENEYVASSSTERRSLADLFEEHDLVRSATEKLFESFSPDMLLRQGKANGENVSVRALGWIIAGHAVHHAGVIRERYL
ncbi:MAG: DinB family protein [Flavobacteriales bacterium]